jgi:hypothetical protein
MRSALAGLMVGALAGVAIAAQSGCVIPRLVGRRLTGTCDGACKHYVECKPGHPETARDRCRAECPDVFSDEDSLMMFESLSCHDTLEYVDGAAPKTSQR